MANPEHVAKLKEGAEAWNAWRKASDEKPDLSGLKLRGDSFEDYDLRSTDFSGADLHEVIFESAELDDSSFERASLYRVTFFYANLRRCNFKSGLSSNLFLSCVLDESDFTSAVVIWNT